jgi:hypothetical protein
MTKPNLLKELYVKQNDLKTTAAKLVKAEKEKSNLFDKIAQAKVLIESLKPLVLDASLWTLFKNRKTIISIIKTVIKIF